MKCRNISKDDGKHSLYINPNGLCNRCMMVKDRAVEWKNWQERNKRRELVKTGKFTKEQWELWKYYGIDLKNESK